MTSLILTMIALPAVAAITMLLLDPHAPPSRARWTALLTTVAAFLLSWGVAAQFAALPAASGEHRAPVQPRFESRTTWLTLAAPKLEVTDDDNGAIQAIVAEDSGLRIEFYLGLDGISLSMLLLTTILSISAVLVSWNTVSTRASEFYACLLILETGLLGVFCAFDLVLFYVFFEFTLLPLFFLVGIWGGPLRRHAAARFFIYTLAGSLITLLGLVALAVSVHNTTGLATPFSIPDLSLALLKEPLPRDLQTMLFLTIAAGFMVKLPVFPFHTWLPLTYVEAPAAATVMLAGVMAKLGAYGFLRLIIPLLPDACLETGVPLLAGLSVVGIIYGSFCALTQNDIKRLVAYSSIAHLGFCMLGLFALNSEGIAGGVLQMINHGLSTGALFCLVGFLYERYHTRLVSDFGGLAARLPLLAVAFVFIAFANIGLPGLNGFVGEVLALIGMYRREAIYAALGAMGVILGAWYLLGMLQTVFFGPLKEPHMHTREHDAITDLNLREVAAIAPLAALCLWIGLFPQPLLNLIGPDVDAIAHQYKVARAPAPATATASLLGMPAGEGRP